MACFEEQAKQDLRGGGEHISSASSALAGMKADLIFEQVREYQRRYGRMPPKGFDRWYAFAKYHDVQLIE